MARRRRSAAEARRAILDAASAQLIEIGPDALRLDDIAEAVGVSRQAILHHFGSRQTLVHAVVEQAWTDLFTDLMTLAGATLDPVAFVDKADAVIRTGGNARVGAWLILTDQALPEGAFQGALSGLPSAIKTSLGTELDEVEIRDALILLASALFGDAIFGERIREAFGADQSEAERRRFRHWVAQRIWELAHR